MKTQTPSIALTGTTADTKISTMAVKSELPSLRGPVSAANKINLTSGKGFATATGN
jgi:hypothetical protein